MKTIIENNKLIAEFLGQPETVSEFPQFGYMNALCQWKTEFTPNELKFNKDWNWLIKAIGKLNEEMKSSIFKTNSFSLISSMVLINDINGAYQHFMRALNHHNEQQK